MIKKAHKTKTKRYHPFHLRDAFYWDLNNSFQSGLILCLIIQLFIYWITIFSTQVAMEKIKGSVKLLKSTCEIEKWNKIIHSRDYFRIAWQFFSGHGKNIRSLNIVCIITLLIPFISSFLGERWEKELIGIFLSAFFYF